MQEGMRKLTLIDTQREKGGMFPWGKNAVLCMYSEQEHIFYVSSRCVRASWWKMCVSVGETPRFDWQEGAAGMCLAAALCGTGTNRSIIAWESNRYGQIVTWTAGTEAVPNMRSPREFFRGRKSTKFEGIMERKMDRKPEEYSGQAWWGFLCS